MLLHLQHGQMAAIAGFTAVVPAAWVCESEAGSATIPAKAALAGQAALATTRRIMFLAAVLEHVLAVAAGLYVPLANVLLSPAAASSCTCSSCCGCWSAT